MNQIISGWIGTYTPNNQYSVDGVDVIYYDSKKIANDHYNIVGALHFEFL